jgi:hypothetical protein
MIIDAHCHLYWEESKQFELFDRTTNDQSISN